MAYLKTVKIFWITLLVVLWWLVITKHIIHSDAFYTQAEGVFGIIPVTEDQDLKLARYCDDIKITKKYLVSDLYLDEGWNWRLSNAFVLFQSANRRLFLTPPAESQ